MSLEVRQATPAENRLVSEVLTEACHWMESCGMPLWRPEQLTPEQTEPDVRAGWFFLAFAGEDAVGTVRLTPSDPLFWPEAPEDEALSLHRLAVRRAAAGGDVSSALLHFAVERARAERRHFVRLDVDAARDRLRAVYERFGFVYHSDREIRGLVVARYQLGCGK